MRLSTIIAILITIALTVVFMQNTDEANFTLLFVNVKISKLVVMTAVSVSAFILGILAGRPRKVRRPSDFEDDDDEFDNTDRLHKPNTLSDEDRDYIS